jgi:hypothetical protein
MIEGFLRERLQAAYPQLTWSENNYEDQDNTGTVYAEGGGAPSRYEDGFRFPNYMVWVRSSDFSLAERASKGSVELLNKLNNEGKPFEYTDYEGIKYNVYFVEATGEANRVGRDEGVMEWSSNFRATIRRIN